MKVQLIFLIVATTLISACQKKTTGVNTSNLVVAKDVNTKQFIGDNENQFTIIAKERLANDVLQKLVYNVDSENAKKVLHSLSTEKVFDVSSKDVVEINNTAAKSSLILGYPVGLLNQQSVFGGVVTKISNVKDQYLGALKLGYVLPVHVVSIVDEKNNQLLFVGCAEKCFENSEQKVLLQIPIVGVDSKGTILYLDLSTLGTQLNIIREIDPTGTDTGLTHKYSNLVTFDFSLNTLVFDVDSVMKFSDTEDVTVTARWFLKLASGFNPAFEPRKTTEGVGYYTTERALNPVITRFSTTNSYSKPITKYYVKNVPERYRAGFSEAFNSWNRKSQEILGRDLFEYEYLEKTDPRYDLIIAGDIRYNVLEWDLVNLASYGGYGPSIANQFTGEMLSANILIQGPRIEDVYKKWFDVSDKIKEQIEKGNTFAAEKLRVNFSQYLNQINRKKDKVKYKMSLNNSLSFYIGSDDPRYQDSLVQTLFFETVPEGYTYDKYMYGYFVEIVAHEIGHNLGLLHNFKGSLGSKDSMERGSVSRSIMEYLGKDFRYLNTVGEYDSMAIAYGYLGKLPEHKDWFCTDEDKPNAEQPNKSAECSSSDATSDPFGYFEKQLDKVINLILAKDSTEASAWKFSDIESPLSYAIRNMVLYAISAPFTADKWTNFYLMNSERPTNPLEIPKYILTKLNSKICSNIIDQAIDAKETAEDKQITKENILALQKHSKGILKEYKLPFNIYTDENFPCLIKF